MLRTYGKDGYLEFPMAKATKDIADVENLLEEKLRQLGEEPGQAFFVSLDRLKRKLQHAPIGILIDNLEPALDSTGKFISLHRRYIELLRVLTDPTVQSTTLITSRERLQESSVAVEHYFLQSLSASDWERVFAYRGLSPDAAAVTALHHAYGGNAKAMEIVSSAVLEDCSGDISAYWQENQNDLLYEQVLEDLVSQQFDRLKQLNPNAYKLLCRMGCYRYQDIPMVPKKGLYCLLWDVASEAHRRTVKFLRDRRLVECQQGNYALHPVIRAEAITRLESRDRGIGHQKIQDFWTHQVESIQCLEDALIAFEAHFHCLEMGDFEQAAKVLIKRRADELNHEIMLGDALYRMGLTKQVISAISLVIQHPIPQYEFARLHSTLADSYRIQGNVRQAIDFQKKSIGSMNEILHFQPYESDLFNRISNDLAYSHLSIGLYLVDLWELEAAGKYFQKIIVENSDERRHALAKAEVCLAFVKSCLGSISEAKECLERAEEKIVSEEASGGTFVYFLIFLALAHKNLRDFEKSKTLYEKVVCLLQNSQHHQTRARALSGMGEVLREEGNLRAAIDQCSAAAEISRHINAKVDLAEALFQLGLSYQLAGKTEECQSPLQEAINIFTEIDAPKQVSRIRSTIRYI
ncbi:MAG: tetratricopeptide repeat protein [Cyanobacteria bacterium J06636_16]